MKTLDDERLRRGARRGRFSQAFRGTKRSVRGESNFFVYLFSTAAVLVAAMALDASLVEWAVLLLCVTVVLGAEMFNTALQRLAQGSTNSRPHLSEACDISQAAVLVVTIGAGVVALLILAARWNALLDTY